MCRLLAGEKLGSNKKMVSMQQKSCSVAHAPTITSLKWPISCWFGYGGAMQLTKTFLSLPGCCVWRRTNSTILGILWDSFTQPCGYLLCPYSPSFPSLTPNYEPLSCSLSLPSPSSNYLYCCILYCC